MSYTCTRYISVLYSMHVDTETPEEMYMDVGRKYSNCVDTVHIVNECTIIIF